MKADDKTALTSTSKGKARTKSAVLGTETLTPHGDEYDGEEPRCTSQAGPSVSTLKERWQPR